MTTISNEHKRSKSFTFTWNNYESTENWEEMLNNFAKIKCEFLCFSKETSPTTNTKHLQGYFTLNSVARLSTINNHLQHKVHLETAKKCKLANYRYCSKTGKAWVWDSFSKFEGWIDKSKQTDIIKSERQKKKDTEEKYKKCIILAKQNKMDIILNEYPQIYLQYKEKLNAIRLDFSIQERMFLNNEYGNFFKCHFLWLWGPTGLGKSYFCSIISYLLNKFYETINQQFNKPFQPLEVYYKNKNKWWDRYNNEQIVIIEEASPETMKTSGHYYKQWIDEYPFNPEVKGATLNYIRPKFIIITSNYSLKRCFSDDNNFTNLREEDYEPLKRRLHEYHLTNKEIPNWPNYNDLYRYEYFINTVKKNHTEKINNIIKNLNFENIQNNFNPSTSKTNTPKNNSTITKYLSFNQDSILKELESFTDSDNESISSNTNQTINSPINIPETPTFQEPPTSPILTDNENITTIFTINNFKFKKIITYCIKCFKQTNSGLFCKNCSIINNYHYNELLKIKEPLCNRCNNPFTAIIDAHCPSCTNYLKERYNKLFPVNYDFSKESDKLDPNFDYERIHEWYNIGNTYSKYNNSGIKNTLHEQFGLYFDNFNNLFYSKKQASFIYSKLILIRNIIHYINTKLNPTQSLKDQILIDKYVLKIDKLINKHNLKQYRYFPIKRRWKTTTELSIISKECNCFYCLYNLNNCPKH